jgi:hypothetical protein
MRFFYRVDQLYSSFLSSSATMIAILKAAPDPFLTAEDVATTMAASIRNLSVYSMVDHIARADELRKRAVQCRLVAKEMTSTKFEECCGRLADHYVALADMEEGFARRTAALRQATNEALLTGLT